jgi:tagatose 1,6-diphosphate aldolase GatY/KbaY
MPLVSLNAVLPQARAGAYAVGAFNIFDFLCMQSVVAAAVELGSPVILQVLPPVVDKFGCRPIAAWAKALAEEYPQVPLVLHLDHGRELAMIEDCIRAGWSSVMIDASDKPLNENIDLTRAVTAKAHAASVSVEGEVGCILTGQDAVEVRESAANLAQIDSCELYSGETTVDALAPAIGTAHGLYKEVPNLDCDRLRRIVATVGIPVVIHGGTGLSTEDFRRLIACGASKINIATQIYMTYMQSLERFAADYPGGNNPLAFFEQAGQDIRETVKSFIRIFGCQGKAAI